VCGLGYFRVCSILCLCYWWLLSLTIDFHQVEDEEEEKSEETVRAPPDGSVTPTDEVCIRGTSVITLYNIQC